MNTCITVSDFAAFMNLTGLPFTTDGILVIVHAIVGDVVWLFRNGLMCVGTGVVL